VLQLTFNGLEITTLVVLFVSLGLKLQAQMFMLISIMEFKKFTAMKLEAANLIMLMIPTVVTLVPLMEA